MDILKIMLSASVAVVYLFILSKLMGKKQIAELDFINYVMGISIGSIAAEMATDLGDKPIYLYLISITIFVAFNFLISLLSKKSSGLERFFTGTLNVVIKDGQIDEKGLKKSGLTVNELLAMMRADGYFDITQVAYGLLETNGNLSILPVAASAPVINEDMGIVRPSPPLLSALVTDGKIAKQALKYLGKNNAWLLDKLGVDESGVKDIVLALYDEVNDTFTIQNKTAGN